MSEDSDPVPFVKIKLPKDKCAPMPKAKGGGLLGVVFNLASSVVNGVVDSACHLEFPVIKGGPPSWLSMDIFPPMGDFPPDPDDDEDPETETETTSTPTSTQSSTQSSSSSSCSASGVAQCTASCAVSTNGGTATSKCATVCSTVTACSGMGTTSSTASTITGIVTPISIEEDEAESTEWYADQMSVLSEAIDGAPSTLAPSIMSALALSTDWPEYDDSTSVTSTSSTTTSTPTTLR